MTASNKLKQDFTSITMDLAAGNSTLCAQNLTWEARKIQYCDSVRCISYHVLIHGCSWQTDNWKWIRRSSNWCRNMCEWVHKSTNFWETLSPCHASPPVNAWCIARLLLSSFAERKLNYRCSGWSSKLCTIPVTLLSSAYSLPVTHRIQVRRNCCATMDLVSDDMGWWVLLSVNRCAQVSDSLLNVEISNEAVVNSLNS